VKNVKLHSRDLALTAVFAALYAVGVLAFASISFQIVQVRVADALIPLSIVFGWPAALGVTIGCAIANFASAVPGALVPVDVTLGSVANLVASLLAWRIGKSKAMPKNMSQLIGCLAAALAVTFIVGTYLAVLYGMEPWVWWIGIGAGSLISIFILGYILVQIISRIHPVSDAT
jgi:uncharacterized membrane protein